MPSPETRVQGPHLTEEQVWKGLGAAARGAAAIIISIGVVWGALWWAFEPRIDAFFDNKLTEFRSEFRAEVGGLKLQLTRIEAAMPDRRPFIEIKSGGRIHTGSSFQAGETITLLYLLRRNKPCPSKVMVQFWSENLNSIASEYNYVIVATPATTALDFGLFPVRVRLPMEMVSGWYSYTPLLIADPIACPEELPVQVQPSDFFEVRGRG